MNVNLICANPEAMTVGNKWTIYRVVQQKVTPLSTNISIGLMPCRLQTLDIYTVLTTITFDINYSQHKCE